MFNEPIPATGLISTYDAFIRRGLTNPFKESVIQGGTRYKIENIKKLRELGFTEEFHTVFGMHIGLKQAKEIIERILYLGENCFNPPVSKTIAQIIIPINTPDQFIALGELLKMIKNSRMEFDFNIEKVSLTQ